MVPMLCRSSALTRSPTATWRAVCSAVRARRVSWRGVGADCWVAIRAACRATASRSSRWARGWVRARGSTRSTSGSRWWARCLARDGDIRSVRSSSATSACSSGSMPWSWRSRSGSVSARSRVSSGSVRTSQFSSRPAGQLDVGGFAVEAVGADGDGQVPGAALGAVGGEGVAVGDLPAPAQVAVVEDDVDVGAGVEADGEPAGGDRRRRGRLAVGDADVVAGDGVFGCCCGAGRSAHRPGSGRRRRRRASAGSRPRSTRWSMAAWLSRSTSSLVPASSTGRSPASIGGEPRSIAGGDHAVGVVGDDDPVVVEVGVDGGGDVAVAQLGEGVLFPRLALAAVDGELGDAVGVVGGVRRTRRRRRPGELVVVADQQHPAAGRRGGGDDVFEGADVGHPGLVDHQQRSRASKCRGRRSTALTSECRVRAGMPAPAASSIAARADGAAPITAVAGAFEGGADGVEGERLAGAGRADQHRDRRRRRRTAGRRRRPGRRRGRPVRHHGGDDRAVDRSSRRAAGGRRRRGSGARRRAARGSSTAAGPSPSRDGEHLVGGEDPVGDPLDRVHRRART